MRKNANGYVSNLYLRHGDWFAEYATTDHKFCELRFIGYSKSQVINKLRHEYNLVVPARNVWVW